MIPDPDNPAESPTAERLRMAGSEVEDFVTDSGRRTKRMLDGHVLELLVARRSITGDQYSAGCQYYEDWFNSGLANSGVIDPGRVIVDGGKIEHASDFQLNALTRWQRAVRAVGLIHSQVLSDVLLSEITLEAYGRRVYKQANPKLAKLAATASLVDALRALDYHYHGQRHTRPSHSHEPGYRPVIQPADIGD